MDKNRVVVEVNGRKLHLVLGNIVEEWEKICGTEETWGILLEEFLDGAIEIDEHIWYWYIDGRCYETTEEVEE